MEPKYPFQLLIDMLVEMQEGMETGGGQVCFSSYVSSGGTSPAAP
jgi:hypothetical protein